MSTRPQIAEIQMLDDQVLVIFKPKSAALLTQEDLHDLAVQKKAFIKPEDLDELPAV